MHYTKYLKLYLAFFARISDKLFLQACLSDIDGNFENRTKYGIKLHF